MKEFISIRNGHAVTTDIQIAEAFGKRTSDLKRLIRKLPCPKHFSERNFTLTSYIDKQGKQRPMYEITKDGFVLLVMGFTGERAIEFKIRYIEAFNAMEKYLHIHFDQFNKICQRYDVNKNSVSQSARNLVYWKRDKPILLKRIEILKKILQLDLFNNENDKGGLT